MYLTSRTALLVLLAHRNPRIWEIIHPHVPKISEGTHQVMTAMVIKSVADELTNREIKLNLQEIGRKIFSEGAKAMNYDDDGWCGTSWPHHFPVPHPDPGPWNWMIKEDETMLNPQPLPPGESYYGAILTLLADAVSSAEMGAQLKDIGASLMKTNGALMRNESKRTLAKKNI